MLRNATVQGGEDGLVPVGPGLVIPQPLTVTTNEAGYEVTVRVTPQAGRLVATELTVRQREGGPPVTLEGIRQLPISKFVRTAGERHLGDTGCPSSLDPDGPAVPHFDRQFLQSLAAEGPTDRTLQVVAFLYRRSIAVGDPPVKSLEAALQLTRSKAGRWIAEARKRGFLGPSEGPGRAAG